MNDRLEEQLNGFEGEFREVMREYYLDFSPPVGMMPRLFSPTYMPPSNSENREPISKMKNLSANVKLQLKGMGIMYHGDLYKLTVTELIDKGISPNNLKSLLMTMIKNNRRLGYNIRNWPPEDFKKN